VTRCSDCGIEVPADEPGSERLPCPNCSSLRRTQELRATVTGKSSVSAKLTVDRGVNEARMAAFAVILATALSVGLAVGFATDVLLGLLTGLTAAAGTALLLATIYRVSAVRRLVMEVMHRITGQ
jgi:DNA-directed RNA polymerase subunit RPC12/RpoP